MKATYILATLIVILVLIIYGTQAARFRREYGGFDLDRSPRVGLGAAAPYMKTGDLILFRHRSSVGPVLKMSMSPFSHGGMVVMRDGVPHIAEATYWASIKRDRLTKYHPRDRYGTTVFPLRDRLEYYPGSVCWAPLTNSLSPDQEAGILRAADNDGEFYTLRPWRSVGVKNFHCFEYVTHLLGSAGLLCREFPRILRSGEMLAAAVLRGQGLLCGNGFGLPVVLENKI